MLPEERVSAGGDFFALVLCDPAMCSDAQQQAPGFSSSGSVLLKGLLQSRDSGDIKTLMCDGLGRYSKKK